MKTMKKSRTMKAFTLVELIVVMVILAILVALMVPSLTKYIDKANDQSILVEARYCLTALQTFSSETYGTQKLTGTSLVDAIKKDLGNGAEKSEIYQMAECPGTIDPASIKCDGSRISEFKYTDKGGTRFIIWKKDGGFGNVEEVSAPAA